MGDLTISKAKLDTLVESGEISASSAHALMRDPLEYIVGTEKWANQQEVRLQAARDSAEAMRTARSQAEWRVRELQAQLEAMVRSVVQAKKIADALTEIRDALTVIVEAAELDNATLTKMGILELATAVDTHLGHCLPDDIDEE